MKRENLQKATRMIEELEATEKAIHFLSKEDLKEKSSLEIQLHGGGCTYNAVEAIVMTALEAKKQKIEKEIKKL